MSSSTSHSLTRSSPLLHVHKQHHTLLFSSSSSLSLSTNNNKRGSGSHSAMSILDLSPVTLLLQEVQTVTSAMRRNQRWATVPASTYASTGLPASISSRGRRLDSPGARGKRRTDDEGDLMLAFIELRRSLTGVTGEFIIRIPPHLPLPDRTRPRADMQPTRRDRPYPAHRC